MNTKPDITNREAIERIIYSFYKAAMVDDLVGHFFTEVVALDLPAHLPRICDFWESTLFYKSGYEGNPIQVHLDLHAKSSITAAHFERWLTLLNGAIDAQFSGPTAELMKTRALSISTVMQLKLKRK